MGINSLQKIRQSFNLFGFENIILQKSVLALYNGIILMVCIYLLFEGRQFYKLFIICIIQDSHFFFLMPQLRLSLKMKMIQCSFKDIQNILIYIKLYKINSFWRY